MICKAEETFWLWPSQERRRLWGYYNNVLFTEASELIDILLVRLPLIMMAGQEDDDEGLSPINYL